MKKFVVILDNGHGEETPGKRSPKGLLMDDPNGTALYEYEFNRDIVERTTVLLDALGIEYHVLVPEIEDITLGERARRVNELVRSNPGTDFFLVSIHANAGGGTGWECFTTVGVTESDTLATVFCRVADKKWNDFRMRFDHSDDDPDKEAQFYILRKTLPPAVLTENFFMDTEKDLEYIISDAGRQAVAEVHAEACKEYINMKLSQAA